MLFRSDEWAHPNSRFTTRLANVPNISPEANDPRGVPIDAIIFGGRVRDREPLIRALRDLADGVYDIRRGRLVFGSYFKIPRTQAATENCVAHNGSLIPIPGRDVMAQGWYQGGISVFDWTNPAKPQEIAFFDRGPVDSTRLVSGGSWSV